MAFSGAEKLKSLKLIWPGQNETGKTFDAVPYFNNEIIFSKLEQIRVENKPVQYSEWRELSDSALGNFSYYISRFPESTSQNPLFLFLEMEQSAERLKMDQLQILADQLFFQILFEKLASLSEIGLPLLDQFLRLKEASQNEGQNSNGTLPTLTHHLFVGFIEEINQLADSCHSLRPIFKDENLPHGIFKLPLGFISEYLKFIDLRKWAEEITVEITYQAKPSEGFHLLFVLSSATLPVSFQEKDLMARIGKFCGIESYFEPDKFIFKVPVVPYGFSDAVIEMVDPILTGTHFLMGPFGSATIEPFEAELSKLGAEIVPLKSVFGINKQLESSAFSLVIWFGEGIEEIKEIDIELLKKGATRLLLFLNNSNVDLPEGLENLVHIFSFPTSIREFTEKVRKAIPQVEIEDVSGPALEENITLNFDKLLEITEGDKSFMRSLFDSYSKSLDECSELFEKHLYQNDVAGLKFLLHKIRATINTFEIKGLEMILIDSIEKIEAKQLSTKDEKMVYAKRVDRICQKIETDLNAFAAREDF
jgi:hypothetical protein